MPADAEGAAAGAASVPWDSEPEAGAWDAAAGMAAGEDEGAAESAAGALEAGAGALTAGATLPEAVELSPLGA